MPCVIVQELFRPSTISCVGAAKDIQYEAMVLWYRAEAIWQVGFRWFSWIPAASPGSDISAFQTATASLCFCLSISLCFCLCFCLCCCLCFCLCLCRCLARLWSLSLSLPVCASFCLCPCHDLSRSFYPPLPLALFLSFSLSLSLYISFCLCLSVTVSTVWVGKKCVILTPSS